MLFIHLEMIPLYVVYMSYMLTNNFFLLLKSEMRFLVNAISRLDSIFDFLVNGKSWLASTQIMYFQSLDSTEYPSSTSYQ